MKRDSSGASTAVRARAFAGLLLGAAAACHGEAATAPASGSGAISAALSASGPSTPTPSAPASLDLAHDPIYVRAATTHDPVDLAALGQHAGATALVAALADPETRPTALSAIPFARDTDLALRPLAAMARAKPSGDEAFALLDTIARATEEPRRIDELLDPEGVHAAVVELTSLAKDAARAERERALAITILGRLADRGFLARSLVPSL